MQNIIFAYAYDFLSILFEKENLYRKIEKIILFGSIARGDFDKESDIDVFIELKDLKEKKEVEEIVNKTINIFEIKAEKTWYVRKIKLPIKPLVGKLEEQKWADLRYEIISMGVLLFGKYEQTPENLRQHILISYSLNRIKQSRKMQFLRKICGYETKRGKKVYEEKGVLAELNGEKIAANQIIIKAENAKDILDIIKKFKIPYTIKEIWRR